MRRSRVQDCGLGPGEAGLGVPVEEHKGVVEGNVYASPREIVEESSPAFHRSACPWGNVDVVVVGAEIRPTGERALQNQHLAAHAPELPGKLAVVVVV